MAVTVGIESEEMLSGSAVSKCMMKDLYSHKEAYKATLLTSPASVWVKRGHLHTSPKPKGTKYSLETPALILGLQKANVYFKNKNLIENCI